jgi:hypothetical protein
MPLNIILVVLYYKERKDNEAMPRIAITEVEITRMGAFEPPLLPPPPPPPGVAVGVPPPEPPFREEVGQRKFRPGDGSGMAQKRPSQ